MSLPERIGDPFARPAAAPKARGVRSVVSAPELFSLINIEFMRLRSAECHRCMTPPPIRTPPAGRNRVNWQLPPPRGCAHGCSVTLAAIAKRFERLYLLAPA